MLRMGMERAPIPCQYRYRHVALAAPFRGALPVVEGIHLFHGVSHYWCVQAHPSKQLGTRSMRHYAVGARNDFAPGGNRSSNQDYHTCSVSQWPRSHQFLAWAIGGMDFVRGECHQDSTRYLKSWAVCKLSKGLPLFAIRIEMMEVRPG